MATLGTQAKPHTELLVEDAKLQIVEGAGKDSGKVFVRGEFGSAVRPTLNNRLYPPSLWEAQIKRLSENLSKRKVVGQADHPENGKSTLTNTSHVVTALRLRDDGIVEGEAEVLNTRIGKDLQEILKAQVPVGVSSRGYGSTKPDGKNKYEVVQDDYKLITFDFVVDPADPDATPSVFYECVEDLDTLVDDTQKGKVKSKKAAKTLSEEEDKEKEKELAAKYAKKIAGAQKEGAGNVEATLRDEFAETILAKVAEMKAGVRKEVIAELLADPEVAAAKQVLEVLKGVLKEYAIPSDAEAVIAEKDKELADLRSVVQKQQEELNKNEDVINMLEKAAREAGYRFQLEKLLRSDEDASIIRSAVGDVTEYESVDALEERVEEIRETIAESLAAKDAEYERSLAQHKKLEDKNTKLEHALAEALQVGKQAGLELYLERRLRNHAQADKIRAVFDRTEISSKEQIDDLLEAYRVPEREPEDLEKIRSRVRKRIGSTSKEHDINEEAPLRKRSDVEDYNGLGTSLTEFRHLAGIRT
jgi:hypothetical protein